jgi:hypothetical protein
VGRISNVSVHCKSKGKSHRRCLATDASMVRGRSCRNWQRMIPLGVGDFGHRHAGRQSYCYRALPSGAWLCISVRVSDLARRPPQSQRARSGGEGLGRHTATNYQRGPVRSVPRINESLKCTAISPCAAPNEHLCARSSGADRAGNASVKFWIVQQRSGRICRIMRGPVLKCEDLPRMRQRTGEDGPSGSSKPFQLIASRSCTPLR